MGIYIQDNKKHTVRQYCTSPKIEKAIETLLQMSEEICYSETHERYEVFIKNIISVNMKKNEINEVLNEIKKEIEEKYKKYKYLFDADFIGTKDLEWILSIIDKYKNKIENGE